MSTDLFYTMSGVGTVILAFLFFYFPWQSFVVDQTRQRLFEIRDKWFDYSTNLTSASDKEAAAVIRAELNYMIRLVHHFTLPVIVFSGVLLFIFSRDAKEGEAELLREINKLQSSEARAEAKKAVVGAIWNITNGMVRRSIVLLTLLPFFALISVIIGGAVSVNTGIKRLVATLAIKDNSRLVPH